MLMIHISKVGEDFFFFGGKRTTKETFNKVLRSSKVVDKRFKNSLDKNNNIVTKWIYDVEKELINQ